MSFTITSSDSMFDGLEAAMKVHYSGQKIENQCYAEHPFLGMVSKYEGLKGDVHPLPIITTPETGGAHILSTAQSNANSFSPKSFFLQVPNDYAVAQITNKAMLASKGDAGAFLDLATAKIDQAMAIASRRLSLGNFRNATGIIGKVASIASGVITLAERGSVVAFEVGMKLVVTTSAAPTAASDLHDGAGYVIAVDRAAGTVTVTAAANGRSGSAGTPTNWAANDYLIVDGDVGLGWNGLDTLIPSGTPADLWGVVRTTDRQRLAGTYLDRSTSTIQEGLIDLANAVAEAGVGHVSHAFCNYATFGALLKEVGAKSVNAKEAAQNGKGEKMTVSYEGLELYTPTGKVVIVPDRDCLPKTVFMLDMSKIKLYSLGPAIQVLSPDGLKWLRQATSDGMEVRIGGYANVASEAPAAHGRVSVAF